MSQDLALKGFLDALTSAFTDIFNTVLLPAVNNQLTNVSLLGAHVLGGLSQETDIIGTLSNLLGKRGIFDDLIDSVTTSFTSAANSLLGNLSLQLAIALANFSQSGGIGKRGIFDDLMDSITASFTSAANSLLGDLSLQLAIALAGFSQNGGLLGKRGMFDDLIDSITASFTSAANSLLGDLSLQLAIALAGFSQNGGLLG